VSATERVEDPTAARAELDQLQSELADRRSIVHFAHSGVAVIVAMIFACAAAKLFWDSAKLPYLGIGASAFALAATIYSLVQHGRAKRLRDEENAQFEKLQALRHALQLDDPSALLPR
jgi:hypothetical protein